MLSRMLYASCAISKIAVLIIASLVVFPEGVRADEFSRIAGPFVSELMRRPDARSHESLTIRQLESLPEVLPRVRTALLIVKTDEGNLAKLLVTPGLRKGKPGPTPSPLVPVLVVERFETLEASSYWSLKAHGKEIVLFGEFPFDLDSGQVVPEGMGGDILFTSAGGNGPRLLALGESRIYTFDRPVLPPAVAPGRPSSGRVVEAGDFTGSYHLIANGQWSGALEIQVKEGGEVTGRFRSDTSGSVYPVRGKIAAGKPQRVGFTIQFPRAEQVYDGLLWTEGKNVLAGTFTMLERPYSFVAVRDGASLAAPEVALEPAQNLTPSPRPVVVVLESGSDRFIVDGLSRSAAELAESLAQAIKGGRTTEVLIRVRAEVPFERVTRAAKAIREAGVTTLRVAPAGEN
ncbi:MAG: ExbD/TolR family protein [Isosphaeraceae bacterium]